MEEIKGFEDIADKVEPWTPSEEFLRDFQKYMENSIRESKINAAKALISARDIVIF